jgi:hypothetical protein
MMANNLVNRSACRARIEKLTVRYYRLVAPCENHFMDFGGFSLSTRFRKTVLVSVETTVSLHLRRVHSHLCQSEGSTSS